MSEGDYVHIILTRFNVKSGGKESKIRMQPHWLDKRFELFETYCLPSVAGQTCKNFVWLIFFDVDTPALYKQMVKDCAANLPQLRVQYIDEWTTANVHTAIRDQIPEHIEGLVTTRLDNDDGIHKDFVKVLHEQKFENPDWYYNFPDGLTFSEGYAFRHKDMSNAFVSRYERASVFATAWELVHPDVIKTRRVTQIPLANAWLQVIHGDNVSNKVRGDIIPPSEWMQGFPDLSNLEVKQVAWRVRLLDSLWWSMYRRGRDWSIVVIKRVLRRK